ncbi:MAG: hypothetical protein GY839_04175 [candidate division Zixibacteria bacterium]|nr:hypothetical protein [candidate division Zixibacteria bacterium]
MKKIIFVLIALCATVMAEEVRVGILFIHYSVGNSAVVNCQGEAGNIRNTLDTMTVSVGADTARIVLRTYNMNFDHLDRALCDTVCVWSGADWCYIEDKISTGFDYNLQGGGVSNRNRIFDAEWYSPILDNLFQKPFKEDSVFWYPFTEHQIPYDNGGNVTELYDLVIFKNPYIIWQDFTQAKADSIRSWYQIVRDSVVNHPEINVAFAMGTPLSYQTGSDADFDSDTSLSKIVYNLANWFASDSFVVHSNLDGAAHKNVWTADFYRPMCETGAGAYNRYCLRDDYWAGSGGQSHLSSVGAAALQVEIIDFIRSATEDILIQRSGMITRRDIDRKILDFREGQADQQEVLDLIEQYNSGGQ